MSPPGRAATFARLGRAAVVVILATAYFANVFQIVQGAPFTAGISKWLDPYFINYVLEHWWHSLLTFSDPASPPMYFPTRAVLGYSVGLVLYAPFYVVVRPFVHPFLAYNLTLFLVMETGTLCLYALARRFIRLGVLEASIVTAFFATSANVINEHTQVWSQTSSVFLIPPIVLIGLRGWAMPRGRRRLLTLWLVGLLSTLLFTQDIYTALFLLLQVMALLVGLLFVPSPARLRDRVLGFWRRNAPSVLAYGFGGLLGGLFFLWVYYEANSQYHGFPREQLVHAFYKYDPTTWRSLGEVVDVFSPYTSMRSFVLIYAAGLLACLPWLNADRALRRYAVWFMFVSFVVILIPLRFQKWSLWVDLLASVPGFSVIRDPKRIIFTFELTAALASGMLLARLPRRSLLRIATVVLMIYLLVTRWNGYVFAFERENAVFDRWVAAPIQVDASCRSFFIRGASTEYAARYENIWGLYGIDAAFVALAHDVPTLNGYTGWWAPDWNLFDPQGPDYLSFVDRWIERHHLQHVCALDIDKRTMTPYDPPPKR